jgi:hypothetical protein
MKDVVHLIEARPVRVEVHTVGVVDPADAADEAVARLTAAAEAGADPTTSVEVEDGKLVASVVFPGVTVAFSIDLQANTIARVGRRFVFPAAAKEKPTDEEAGRLPGPAG